MKITIADTPVDTFSYSSLSKKYTDKAGKSLLEETFLPIYAGEINGLSDEIEAIIVASDLQGNIIENEDTKLLGEVLPEYLSYFIQLYYPKLNIEKIWVFLCGDLYANLDKRGVSGNSKSVWLSFKSYFPKVIGVAGNHDDFGNTTEINTFNQENDVFLLEKEILAIKNLKIAGISGIIGRPDKPQRMAREDYLGVLKKLLAKQPDFLLLHQSPNFPQENLEGDDDIRKVIENAEKTLVFCGHSYWKKSLVTFRNDTQVLNADSKVFLLLNVEK